MVKPRLPWNNTPPRPADVSDALCSAMMNRGAMLEDVNYLKVVPNHFVIEVNEANYLSNYRPIEKRIRQQWSERLLEYLTTANNRQGRKEYYFGGPVRIEIRPAEDLGANDIRIRYRIQAQEGLNLAKKSDGTACLEMLPEGKRWLLNPGVITIGRQPSNDIPLEDPLVQQNRLVSGQHAYLRIDEGQQRVYDGSPEGKPSVNGTYVNGSRITTEGQALKNGDLIVLASLDPSNPRVDTPGVAAFRFWLDCKA